MSTGVLKSQAFTTPGAFTFNVPAHVGLVWVTGSGAGGGGEGSSGGGIQGFGAGASGEQCVQVPLVVTPGGTVTGTIGAKGTKGFGATLPTAGGDTTIGPITLKGGGARPVSGFGGTGGGRLGAASSVAPPFPSQCEGFGYFGGSWGGVGGSTSGSTVPLSGGPGLGWSGGTAGGLFSGTAGGGGGSSIFGQGGAGAPSGQATATAIDPTAYGVGGGAASVGAGTRTGADGGDGAVVFFWIG